MVGTGRFERLRRHERRPLAGVSCALALLAPHIGVLVSAVRRAGSAKIFFSEQVVGTGRFELPTPRTPSECSTRLSHVPTARNRSLIERLGLSLKFYTSLRCRVAEQEASISVSALLRAGLVLRQSQIEFSFLQDLCDQPKPECAAPGDRFFGCAGR